MQGVGASVQPDPRWTSRSLSHVVLNRVEHVHNLAVALPERDLHVASPVVGHTQLSTEPQERLMKGKRTIRSRCLDGESLHLAVLSHIT